MLTFEQNPKTREPNISVKDTAPAQAQFAQSHKVNSILRLQRTIGNQAVLRMLQARAKAGSTGTDQRPNVQFESDGVIQRAPSSEVILSRMPDDPAKKEEQEEKEAAKQELGISAALTPEDRELRKDSLDAAALKFNWISEKVGLRITELKSDLEKEDKPSWSQELLGALVDVALLAGASAFGELIAVKYAHKFLKELEKKKSITENIAEAGQEYVKSLVEEGTTKGIETGRKKLEGGSGKEVIEKFVLSQQEGAIDMYKENQAHFIHIGRHGITTAEGAKALEKAMDEEYENAPKIQYEKARDAWVSYLAQQKFGSRHDYDRKTGQDLKTRVTDMSNQERRDKTTHFEWGHGYDPKDYGGEDQNPDTAPNMGTALFNKNSDAGVLYVMAQLPEIKGEWDWSTRTVKRYYMDGVPKVLGAILNGVNDTIRDQYKGQPLSKINIPRQIVAKVKGSAPNFTLNIDEKGSVYDYKQKQDWLEDCGRVAAPKSTDISSLRQAGIEWLLEALKPEEIKE